MYIYKYIYIYIYIYIVCKYATHIKNKRVFSKEIRFILKKQCCVSVRTWQAFFLHLRNEYQIFKGTLSAKFLNSFLFPSNIFSWSHYLRLERISNFLNCLWSFLYSSSTPLWWIPVVNKSWFIKNTCWCQIQTGIFCNKYIGESWSWLLVFLSPASSVCKPIPTLVSNTSESQEPLAYSTQGSLDST